MTVIGPRVRQVIGTIGTSPKVRNISLRFLNAVPDDLSISISIGEDADFYVTTKPADFRYILPDKEGGVVEIVRDYLNPGDVFVDAGAHIGYYSIIAAELVGPSGEIIAFEPHPDHAERVRKNAKLNDFDVRVEESALSSESNTAELSLADRGGGHSLTKDGGNTIEITTRSLDEYSNSEAVTPDLVKVDVEGAEYDVFRGMSELMTDTQPAIICEVHPGRLNADLKEMFEFLSEHGYSISALPEQEYMNTEELISLARDGTENDFGMETHLHIFARPANEA